MKNLMPTNFTSKGLMPKRLNLKYLAPILFSLKMFFGQWRVHVLVLTVALLSGVACTTTPTRGEMSFEDEAPKADYTTTLEHWTDTQSNYSGISEACEATATLLSTDVLQAQNFAEAKQYNWSSDQFKQTRQKILDEARDKTKVFIKLYTSKDENNNIDKSDTTWNIFLQVGDRRVMPELVKKVYEDQVQLANLYPYITVWSKNYYLTFPISTLEAQAQKAKLTIAGPLGELHLEFPR